MEKPTKEQIKKFLEYLSGLETFVWFHSGDQTPDPDLIAVVTWLKAM